MDRSFLSQGDVIAASRNFVCVRLATYENKDEAEFVSKLYVGRSGEQENTTFTILSPDGQRPLVRVSRGANQTFGTVERMVEAMNRIAKRFEDGTALRDKNPALPTVDSVRLGLNIAASDNLPLVVINAKDPESRDELAARVRSLAWSESFVGRFTYAIASDAEDRKAIEGAGTKGGVLVLQPDRFGLQGTILSQCGPSASTFEIETALRMGAARHKDDDRTLGSHVRDGRRLGMFWETALPVTDPAEARVREQNPGNPNRRDK